MHFRRQFPQRLQHFSAEAAGDLTPVDEWIVHIGVDNSRVLADGRGIQYRDAQPGQQEG